MIIAIGGQKGGAGKSTITASLAVAMHDRGDDVLLLDCDPQGTLATWHEIGEENGEALPVLKRVGEKELLELLPPLRESAQVVLLDLDGRNSVSQRIALANADVFVLPVRAAGPDIWSLGEMIELVRLAQREEVNPTLKAHILFNAQQRTVLRRTLVRGLHGEQQLPIFDTELGNLIAYQEAIVMGSGPTRTSPDETAAKQLRQLLRELDELTKPGASTSTTKKRKQR